MKIEHVQKQDYFTETLVEELIRRELITSVLLRVQGLQGLPLQ